MITRWLIGLFSICCCSLSAQIFTYKMMLFGDSIGRMTVTHSQEKDGTDLYTLESKCKAKILWVTRENYSQNIARYKDGKLLSSYQVEVEHGTAQRWTKATFDGKQYQVESYKGKRSFVEIPVYSIATIFYKEYQNVKRIFYEAEADFSELKHPDSNTIEFKSSDGNRNVYHFENGKVKDAEFHVSIATIYLKLLN